jgi:ribosomal protein S12 methylthiotransferase
MKSIFLVSLGCSKNLVDSEVMLGLLEKEYQLTADPAEADLLLVNTCGFISSAVEEAIDEILALAEYKKEDPDKLLVVTGCMVQRYGDDLRKELPEVDLFIGTERFHEITDFLHDMHRGGIAALCDDRTSFLMDSTLPRRISTPSHRAYLKVTEGCSNHCSYCMIPSIRGKLRSRTMEDLVTEAITLDRAGVKELTLIAQDLLAYGKDLKDGKSNLTTLLDSLIDNTSIPWIRLLYLHPARIDMELLDFIKSHPRILSYFDIPLQHTSSRILKLMNRPYDKEHLEKIITAIRSRLPGAVIRTTLMVGFPGETDADIEEMTEFLKKHRLNHVGVFTYSNEEGCRATTLPDHCPEEVKQQRFEQIMELQKGISFDVQQQYVGRKLAVLVEGESEESELLLEGRTTFQAPEIDGCVYITAGTVNAGDIVQVLITEAHSYDLVGEVIDQQQ